MAVQQKCTMHDTAVLDADPDAVWAEIRDVVNMVKILFGDTVANVCWTHDGGVERVPSRYEFTLLATGDVVHQEIAGRNEVERSITYRSVGNALCIYSYLASYRVQPVTDDPSRSYLEYSREFRIIDDAPAEIVDAVLGMMENQINVLRDYFATPKQDQPVE